MKRLNFILLLTAVLASFGACAVDAVNPDHGTTSAFSTTSGVSYKSGCTSCVLDIYKPTSGPTFGRIAVVFFHGGAWKEGGKLQFHNQAQYLASKGIVAISANYTVGTMPLATR